MRCGGRLVVLVLAALGSAAGCGGSVARPTSAAPTAVPTPSLLFLDSDWTGSTAQGLPISFKVQNGRVVSLAIEWVGRSGAGACHHSTLHSMNVRIFGGGATLPAFNHVQGDLPIFRGVFASPSASSGTVRVSFTTTVECISDTIDWTASR